MLHQCPSTGRGWGSWLYAQYYRGYSLNPLAPERECISINVDQPSLLWWGKTLIIKNIVFPRNNNLKLAGLYSNMISLRLGRDGGLGHGEVGMYVVPWIQPQSSCPGTRTIPPVLNTSMLTVALKIFQIWHLHPAIKLHCTIGYQ